LKSLPATVAVATAAIIFLPTLVKSQHIQSIYDNRIDIVINPYWICFYILLHPSTFWTLG